MTAKRTKDKYWYKGGNQKPVPVILQLAIAILLSFFFMGCGNNGKPKEEISTDTIKKIPLIREIESFATTRTDIRGEVRPQWKKSDSLYTHASTNELIRLASKHKDKIELLVAFRALLMKNPHEAVNVAIAEIEDTTIVHISDGICGEVDRVSNIRICMIQYEKKKYHVSQADSIRLDSAVLLSANSSKFQYSNHLYHRLRAKPKNENRPR